jgi:hypothetical protein
MKKVSFICEDVIDFIFSCCFRNGYSHVSESLYHQLFHVKVPANKAADVSVLLDELPEGLFAILPFSRSFVYID